LHQIGFQSKFISPSYFWSSSSDINATVSGRANSVQRGKKCVTPDTPSTTRSSSASQEVGCSSSQ